MSWVFYASDLTMYMAISVSNVIIILSILYLISHGHCFAHVLSMKREQANSFKIKGKYKIPPPVSGEILPPHVVELMLVLHHDLRRYHGDDTMDYITHISNQAADLWNDVTSLGVNITIRITKTILLPDDADSSLLVEADANLLLRQFCNDWQNNNKYLHGNEFDAMILITRLGMYHDSQFNGCIDRTNLMSGYTVSGVQSVRWSTCSTKSLLEFLKMPRSGCLQNFTSPNPDRLTTRAFPGQHYDMDHQCSIALGRGAMACPTGQRKHDVDKLCQHLKCLQLSKKKCTMTNRPPLDGTPCAINKWCDRGQCTEKPLHHQRQEHKLVPMETTTPMMGDTPSMKTTVASIPATKAKQQPKQHL